MIRENRTKWSTDIRKSHRFFKDFGPSDTTTFINDNSAHRHDAAKSRPTSIPAEPVRVRVVVRGLPLRMLCSATGIQVRRPMGHRGRDRLQHGLHLDVSVQPLSRAVDEFAI